MRHFERLQTFGTAVCTLCLYSSWTTKGHGISYHWSTLEIRCKLKWHGVDFLKSISKCGTGRYSYIYIYSSINSINYTLVSYRTHGKQDLKPQVSGLFNGTFYIEQCHDYNHRTVKRTQYNKPLLDCIWNLPGSESEKYKQEMGSTSVMCRTRAVKQTEGTTACSWANPQEKKHKVKLSQNETESENKPR